RRADAGAHDRRRAEPAWEGRRRGAAPGAPRPGARRRVQRDQPQRCEGPDELLRALRLRDRRRDAAGGDDGRTVVTLDYHRFEDFVERGRNAHMDVDVAVLGGGPGGYTSA